MNIEAHQKVTASHLARDAYLYVRQSTLRQVLENTESTKRQYALRERALALGWPVERIVTIDTDLGQSGASAVDRAGFQRLVAEVGMGYAGIVLGLEVSRLARSSTDWHRLLEICALTDTLILDEDGIYDPSHFNDRLLLGLKGTMSEAELHVLHARLQGGILNQARRGELKMRLPVGLVYGLDGQIALDPDCQVQQALLLVFQTFRRTGSASATVRAFREQGLQFPRRLYTGPHRGELAWGEPLLCRVLHVLHNPRYAGAFFYGRTRTRKTLDGSTRTVVQAREQWHALLPDSHVGYISWNEYEENERRLHDNGQAMGQEIFKTATREGPALLQGLVLCGRCGQRMAVRYHSVRGQLRPEYDCQRRSIERAVPRCQGVPGADLDRAVGDLLVELVAPLALEVTLAVQQELTARADEADRLRQQQVERARYEADLAQRRYLHVDPANRLVADALEADWNDKLRTLTAAQADYEQRRESDRRVLDEQQRADILALPNDFPRLWRDLKTSDLDRKRMVRLLVEDVTLLKDEDITAHIRFRGGATRTLRVALPPRLWEVRVTDPAVVQEIDTLLDQHNEEQVAVMLNERGRLSGAGQPFSPMAVARIRTRYRLRGRFARLRERGLFTDDEMAERLGVCKTTVHVWRRQGLLSAEAYSERDDYLYHDPGDQPPHKHQGKKLSDRSLVAVSSSAHARGAI